MSNPSDLELVEYLQWRIERGEGRSTIAETNLYEKPPWLLQHVNHYRAPKNQWLHFVPREQVSEIKKDQSKNVKRRVEGGGTWRSSGAVKPIMDDFGVKIATMELVTFTINNRPTGWLMHEYVLDKLVFQKLVLCKIMFNATEANAQYAPRLQPIVVEQPQPQPQKDDRLTLDLNVAPLENQHDQDQDHPNLFPDTKFYKVETIVSQSNIQQVSSALLKFGIGGVTVTDVHEVFLSFGSQGGSTERHSSSEFSEVKFVAKVKMEILVSEDQVESVINTIIDGARTGEIGDGYIFVVPVSEVIRVRTGGSNILGERGEKAEKMSGDILPLF